MEKYEITRVYPDREDKVVDLITKEVPFSIFVNHQELVTLLASPTELDELAVGFLYTSGFLSSYEQIEDLTLDSESWTVFINIDDGSFDLNIASRRIYTSGCGRGTLLNCVDELINQKKIACDLAIHRDHIYHLMADFQSRSVGFKETGGVHSAALADADKILVVREDIGRHNALDKIIGYSLMNSIDFSDKIILSSGRVSSEIIVKVQITNIGMLVSRSAPTDQAINQAQNSGITLIGFVRGRKMNVYSGMSRIL